MGWKRKRWPVDSENVEYGSVVFGDGQGVLVRYEGESRPRCMSIPTFVRKTISDIKKGRPLRIVQLCISPRTKRRYSMFFDNLTDWTPAAKNALQQTRKDRQRYSVELRK